MTTIVEEDRSAVTAEPETSVCPSCGAPAEPGQLMCLECGSRLALDYQRPPSWRLPAAVVAAVLLIAGLGVAFALASVTDDADKTTASAPTQTAATPDSAPADTPPTTSQATPAPVEPSTTATPTDTGATTTPAATATTPAPAAEGWPPGKSAFTVVLASMPTKAAAEDKLKKAQDAGISGAAILKSDDFPTLNPGYWVVFDGQFDTVEQAQSQAEADRGKGEFADAYPRFVSKDPNAKP